MSSAEFSPGSRSNVVITSQIVRDVKVGGGRMRPQLIKDTNRLRAGLLEKEYIPGDKVNCEFRPIRFTDDGALLVEIYGGMMKNSDLDNGLDTHVFHPFHLDLKSPLTLDQITSMSLEDLIVQHCNDVVVDDGGNAHNMAINMALISVAATLRNKVNLIVFSSSDPLKRLPDAVRERMRDCFQYYLLTGVDDRIAIQFPWEMQNESGTFGLNSDSVDISGAVRQLLATRHDLAALMRSANCFITSDQSFQELRIRGQPGRYRTIVNAATKWRSAIANLAYGTDMLLPMNYREAADVAHIIKHVGREQELHRIERRPFASPLKTNGNEISHEALHELDEILWQLTRYNPLHHRSDGLVTFNYPITFEEHGGLVVGTYNRHSLVAFTSTPDEPAERRILDEYGDPAEMSHTRKIEPMGSGDAAASVVAILNTIDPQEFFEALYEGREKTNTKLHHAAQTIFASALSRVTGMFMIHTLRTHLANVDLSKLQDLLRAVARESLRVARELMSGPGGPQMKDMSSLGLKVVTWNLGTVHNPESEALVE